MNFKDMAGMLARYLFLLLAVLQGLALIYAFFSPLTLISVSFISSLFYDAFHFPSTNTLFIESNYIYLIPACIAGAAYYLLLFLNLTTPMSLKQRILSLVFLLSSFFILNITRILLFIALFILGYPYFDIAHRFVWYLGSTVLVVALWFAAVALFKITEVPVVSDIRALMKETRQPSAHPPKKVQKHR